MYVMFMHAQSPCVYMDFCTCINANTCGICVCTRAYAHTHMCVCICVYESVQCMYIIC